MLSRHFKNYFKLFFRSKGTAIRDSYHLRVASSARPCVPFAAISRMISIRENSPTEKGADRGVSNELFS
jgi:hypothetical protein